MYNLQPYMFKFKQYLEYNKYYTNKDIIEDIVLTYIQEMLSCIQDNMGAVLYEKYQVVYRVQIYYKGFHTIKIINKLNNIFFKLIEDIKQRGVEQVIQKYQGDYVLTDALITSVF